MSENLTRPPRYSIVVPFHNEQETLATLYGQLVEVMEKLRGDFELVFIDDGSTDRTAEILRRIWEGDRRVHVLTLKRNHGQTAALAAGFDYARGEIIISMDGDLQHDPYEIPDFVNQIDEGYDLVSGWRYDRKDNLVTRRIPSRIANWMMAKLSGVSIHDFGTTFKAYRRETIKGIHLYGELHRFIPALASWNGARIAEVGIKNLPRSNGVSHYNLTRTIRVLFDILTVRFLLKHLTCPLHFFGSLGLIGLLISGGVGVKLAIDKILFQSHIFVEHGPLLLVAVVSFFSSIQLISLGLIGEVVVRTYFETRSKPIYSLEGILSHEAPSSDQSKARKIESEINPDPVLGGLFSGR